MKPPCVAAVAHLLAFHVLVSATEPVHSQSKTSCLMQHRADASKWLDAKEIAQDSPFSDEQRHCIREYASSVDADIPGFAGQLAHRKFGGAGAAATNDSVILGAGFGTTATRSLFTFAAQLGRRVHHWSSAADPPEFWTQLNGLVSKKHPDGASGCYKAVNAMNFSASLAGHDMLLDTPLAEHFLDFYAVSPNSK
ncbi:Crnkl1, partial [Symbiodinium necroappetens]